ncbi:MULTISPECIES: K(+)-transporting ATPase subunit C [Clostridium]|uniref:K(+)-transporting ATPase subunit C n=1 Tax=Clostridium TaxID=1485 RepID=UPI00069EA84D|nr:MULTISPECIES: K(+)-transporting ATPase subunit C [Clostridium]KOF56067.1 potassium-transporting ATPase subunit C [Clostridium sp. DMHC 10]MCD2345722.1 K(+)-transporting ATPase subunit C [Clostridium guangxiense]
MKSIIKAVRLCIVLVVVCGIIYPLFITGIGQAFLNKKANGSIITYKGKEVGSALLGQNFTDKRFFRGRVSAVNYNTYTKADLKPDKNGKTAYAGVGSGSQQLAPSNKELSKRVKNDINDFLKTHPGVSKKDIPTDLLTSSGSGLDPDISPKAAEIQVPAISKATGISEEKLKEIIKKYTTGRTIGILGEPRVNVLKVNLEVASLLK